MKAILIDCALSTYKNVILYYDCFYIFESKIIIIITIMIIVFQLKKRYT